MARFLFWLMVVAIIIGINTVGLLADNPHSGMFMSGLASLVGLVVVLSTRKFAYPDVGNGPDGPDRNTARGYNK